jgi:hypothetical protein
VKRSTLAFAVTAAAAHDFSEHPSRIRASGKKVPGASMIGQYQVFGTESTNHSDCGCFLSDRGAGSSGLSGDLKGNIVLLEGSYQQHGFKQGLRACVC